MRRSRGGSRRRYDRETKYAHFRRIDSLRAHVLVSQDEPLIEVYTRNADESWTLRDVRAGVARVEPIDCALDLATLYANPLAG